MDVKIVDCSPGLSLTCLTFFVLNMPEVEFVYYHQLEYWVFYLSEGPAVLLDLKIFQLAFFSPSHKAGYSNYKT